MLSLSFLYPINLRQMVTKMKVKNQDLIKEHEALTAAIDDGTYREEHNKLYAARQALSWAIDPESAASPYTVIMRGTQGEPGGYLAEPRQPRS
jgi:hypothetical protein